MGSERMRGGVGSPARVGRVFFPDLRHAFRHVDCTFPEETNSAVMFDNTTPHSALVPPSGDRRLQKVRICCAADDLFTPISKSLRSLSFHLVLTSYPDFIISLFSFVRFILRKTAAFERSTLS